MKTTASKRRLRPDSKWVKLTAEQRETLEGWLFIEHLGYDEALERAQKQFGISASPMSLSRFYQYLADQRLGREFQELEGTLNRVYGTKVNWYEAGAAGMTLVAKRMVQLAVESPHKVKELATLARVLVANEAQNIRRGWLEIGRGKYEWDTATACLIHKIEMDAIAKDESLDDGQRLQKIREELFGPNLPK